MNGLKSFIEMIYPEKNICFVCDEHEESIENHLCSECRESFEFLEGQVEEDTICPLKYTDEIREVIFKYKYSKNPYLYKMLGPLLLQALEKKNIEIDLIVPIPLTRRKKAKRGFNQSELLAGFLAEKLGIEMDAKNLIKHKKTRSQSGLSKPLRRGNIKGAFSIRENVFKDKNVLVVDDITTTGATYNEASRNLREAGAKKTYLITIATGRDA